MTDKELDDLMAEREQQLAARAKARARQAKLDELTLAGLEELHGEDQVRGLRTIGGLLVVGVPPAGEVSRFRELAVSPDAVATPKRRLAVSASLARSAVLYPELPEYDAILAKHAGVVDLVVKAALQLAGEEELERAGK